MRKFINEKVRLTCEKLLELSQHTVCEIPEMKYIPCDYKSGKPLPVPDESWDTFKRDDFIIGEDKHFWFYTEYKTPAAEDGKQIVFELSTSQDGVWDATNPQILLYLNGEIACGMDINHRRAVLKPDTDYKILIYFYTGMMKKRVDVLASIKQIDLRIQKLYYDMFIPYQAAICYDAKEYPFIRTMKHLEYACGMLNFSAETDSEEFLSAVAAADEYMIKEYYEKECGNSDAVVSLVGHTHIDVAWLWTLDQTREKVQRTFSTVLSLMDRYPEYIFMSSQPQLYQYLKEEAPEIYEKVKEKVKEGRWEVDGAMWLEADCNLCSGESLIRQILYGKRFIKDEFGIDSRILWLPDVFGYSAALPQILLKSGVDKFVTSKISWCDTNKLPYDSFMWEGLDGSEIFTYFLTARDYQKNCDDDNLTTYVGHVTPSMALGTWERYQQKDYNNETVITYGYGDGGGGPTEEMLEAARRLEYGLPGIPKTQMSTAGDFLERVKDNFDKSRKMCGRTPKWVGELYLELHRGTYTSMAKNKKNNRECEFLCQTTETLSAINTVLNNGQYPSEKLHSSWKTLLLNQFHDIIPGSSIKQVYDRSDIEYAQVRESIGGEKKKAVEALANAVNKQGVFVYNPNSFAASGQIEYNGVSLYARDIPPMGWKVIDYVPAKFENVQVSDKLIESKHYIIKFDGNMNIESIYDKDLSRNVLKDGKKGNCLQVFEDRPFHDDNWEVTDFYADKAEQINSFASAEPMIGNGFGGFKITRNYRKSQIVQEIIIYSEDRRIDFKTTADWHENHVLLKASFPIDVHSSRATYDVQFGNIERNTHKNTSWDAAKFEVCAQKWADISEEGFGVALLNDCKYGYSADGNDLKLTLIKCGTFPNEECDQGFHSLTYSLLPHAGDYRRGDVINQAYLLNRPFEIAAATGKGNLNDCFSFVSCDMPNIVMETLKKAEDGNCFILRMYDAWDKRSVPQIKLAVPAKKVTLCDMTENDIEEIGSGDCFRVPVKNFEIVTLKIEF